MKKLHLPRHSVILPEDLENLSLDDLDIQESIDPREVSRLTFGFVFKTSNNPDPEIYDQRREYTF